MDKAVENSNLSNPNEKLLLFKRLNEYAEGNEADSGRR